MSSELKECGVLAKGAVEKIAEHYRHAVKKHPYFCDNLLPLPYDLTMTEYTTDLRLKLAAIRGIIKTRAEVGRVDSEMLLQCELEEVYEAIALNNKTAAVEECYDCIAVLLRMVDVLEGRQELGKPDDGKKGDIQ